MDRRAAASLGTSLIQESTNAAALFGFQHGDDACEVIQERMVLFEDALNICDGYECIVDDEGENLSGHQILSLTNKFFTSVVYMIML